MGWKVELSNKVYKNLEKIPKRTKESFQVLLDEIKTLGPVRGNWPNYKKLSKDCHHCHLQKKGKPTTTTRLLCGDKGIVINHPHPASPLKGEEYVGYPP